MQRRVVHLFAQMGQRDVQLVRGITGVGAAIDIAFQHLHAQPVALTFRDLLRHLFCQVIGFAQQRLWIVNQLNRLVALMAVNRHFQCFNSASTGGHQRHNRAAEARRERIHVDTDLLFLGNIEHVQRDHARNAQLEQLQRQVEVTFEVGGVDHVNQQVGITAQNIVAGNLLIQRGL